MSAAWPIRRMVSRAGIAAGILFLLSIADTLVGNHLEGKFVIRTLPGTRQPISGDLNQPAERPENVQVQFDDPGLQLTVAQVRGRFWRGELTIPPDAAEGVYRLRVFSGPMADPALLPVFRIKIFTTPAAMNASYPSLSRRFFGIPPWWIGAVAAVLLAVCLALVFILDDDREKGLAAEGLAPIVKLARRKDHWEVAAALIQGYGVSVGHCLEVVDRNRRPVSPMIITHIDGVLACGRLDLTVPVSPDGYLRFSAVEAARPEKGA